MLSDRIELLGGAKGAAAASLSSLFACTPLYLYNLLRAVSVYLRDVRYGEHAHLTMVLKLKLTGSAKAVDDAPASEAAPAPAAAVDATKLPKITFKKPAVPQATAPSPSPSQTSTQPSSQIATPEEPRKKRSYVRKKDKETANGASPASAPKKRKQEDDDSTPSSSAQKRPKVSLKLGSSSATAITAPQIVPLQRQGSVKIKLTGNKPKKVSTGPKRVTVSVKGRPPERPKGVGYDSEAEDVEEDPAIQNAFILRMQPGADCDYLRKAIDERKIGIPLSQGGADIQMRFFDRSARRGMLKVRGTTYATCLVDLPCVIEGMKSWDKKGWWKSVDICQMLLVLGKAQNEETAKNYPLPRDVDKQFQYPHGLTPPMHNVRRRRFRKRLDYRTIENVEREVDQLLALDEAAERVGGEVRWEMVDEEAEQTPVDDEEDEEDEDEDAEGVDDNGFYENGGEAEADDNDADLEAMLEEGLASGEEPETPADGVTPTTEITIDPNNIPAPVAAALANGTAVVETPQTAAGTSADEDEDEGDEGDEEDEDEEMDDDALRKQREDEQHREEIRYLEEQIRGYDEQIANQANEILKNKTKAKRDKAKKNLELARSALGGDAEDDDD